MTLVFYFFILITVCYSGLVIAMILGFDKVHAQTVSREQPQTAFSIVIPFRDEAVHLPALLKSLDALQYPKNLFEVLLVNDDSTDDSVSVIEIFQRKHNLLNIKILPRDNHLLSPKKDALNTAISIAKHPWIICTDADCTVPEYWLQSFDQFIEISEAKFIAGPVSFYKSKGLLHHFQVLNFLSLAGSTIGSFGLGRPLFCNGANMAFTRQDFEQLDGFTGNESVASGDDVFLLEKFSECFPKHTRYLNSDAAMVQTHTMPDWRSFLHQQFRWAAKSTGYTSSFTQLTGVLVLLMNASLLMLLLLSVSSILYGIVFVFVVAIKVSIDFVLLYKAGLQAEHRGALLYYPVVALLYPFFIVFTAIGAFSRPFKWKERQFRR